MQVGGLTIGLIVLVIVGLIILIGVLKRIKRCPADKILVIYGSGTGGTAKCVHGGSAFVWPIFQDCQFLDLTPFSIPIDLRNALSRQNIRISVPASFTVGIATEPKLMQNAAVRLLGKSLSYIRDLAQDIILGQLRQVIATMDIEELNSQREKFLREVSDNVETELGKIGLKLINANITDITDESGYIDALGQKAAAKATNDAKRDVAQFERDGLKGETEAKVEAEIAVANQKRALREKVAEQNALAVSAEKNAEKEQRTAIANANAAALAAEKEAERAQRASVAASNANAIAAENEAKAHIALSEAKRREAEAEASARAYSAEKVQQANALAASYSAEEKAELARAERQKATMQADILVQAEIEKRRIEIAAEAEAEAIRRKSKGAADAMLMKMQAEADGIKAQLTKRAEGYAMLVKAAGNDASAAVQLLMTDKVEDIAKIQTEAIKNVSIDKITVWDSMNGEEGGSTTRGFLNSLMKTVPPMKDMMNMVGIEMPGVKDAKPAVAASAAAKPALKPGA